MAKKLLKAITNLRYTKLNVVKFGIAGGIVTAICVFITTILAMYGYCTICGDVLLSIYGAFGYSISFIGSIIGAIYGFIDGFIFIWVFAWIYNKLI